MGNRTKNGYQPAVERLDEKTRAQWLRLSAQTVAVNAGPAPSLVNAELEAAAQSEPQSPLAPAYKLWMADNLAREARYLEAIKAFDSAVDLAQSARRFLPQLDPIRCALLHKAQAASISGNAKIAIATYQELAKVSSDAAESLFQAGLVAEIEKDDEQAAHFYRSVASTRPSSRTDDPAELARRALQRLEEPKAIYLPSAMALGNLLATSLEDHDTGQLDRLISKTHFAVGVVGGHTIFGGLISWNSFIATYWKALWWLSER
ncbi:MAG: tetratricopeptide repeat protein [Nitrosospira sp.]